MATTSRLCVEHVENMGIHYYQTLRCWRKNFMERQNEILALGFNEKFIRTWEYYFDYCGAGFKLLTLGNYQVHYPVTILKYPMSMQRSKLMQSDQYSSER
ncbi:uncharacterized protein LOC106767991 isoform X1 [Vigna radiata var. radiata]|uniref:Uncharacterized protein LOC106767991 isoform X1 n=1 Tax=Vigna radiata var. radiata TaxID=3916 RepID=A0A1S3UQV1_VIGRR|nr:uncharacterized protein LOC106767991 isoform X1 [Vigna radiata var. radiata]